MTAAAAAVWLGARFLTRSATSIPRALFRGAAASSGAGVIDLGNEKDVADYVLHTHGGPRSNSSVGGDGGYETAASEVSCACVVLEHPVGELVHNRVYCG